MRHDPLLSTTALGVLRHGTGHVLSVVLIYLGVGLLLVAWLRLGREVSTGAVGVRGVTRAVLWWTVPLLLAPPLFSTDLYTYLAQGVVAHSGANPYTTVPSALSHPIIDDPGTNRWLTITSPYGPAFILLVKTVIGVTGANLILASLLTRLVLAAGLILLCVALPGLCRHLGGRPANALWFGAANPLVLLHLVGGAHNDLLMIGLLALGTLLVLDHAHVRGFALVTTAAAVKAPAAIALPFLMWIWLAHRPHTPRVRVISAAIATVISVFGLWTIVAGVNLGWLTGLGGNSSVEPWLSAPTAVGKILGHVLAVDPAGMLAAARLVGWVLLAVIIGWLWWRSRSGGVAAVRGATFALLATVVFSAVTFPWYFSWPLALGAAMTWPSSRTALAAGAAVWLVLTCHPDGVTLLPWWGFAAVYVLAPLVALAVARKPSPAVGKPHHEQR